MSTTQSACKAVHDDRFIDINAVVQANSVVSPGHLSQTELAVITLSE